MDSEPEVIKKQMEDTRASLSEKIGALQSQLTDTVQSSTAAVTDTVETVKGSVEAVTDTVQETVQTVKDAFDFRHHIEAYPWAALGGAVAVGCLGGLLLGGKPKRKKRDAWPRNLSSSGEVMGAGAGNGSRAAQPPPPKSVPTQAVRPQPAEEKSWFMDQLSSLKGLAIGTLLGVVRDLVVRSVPDALGPRIGEEVNRFTAHLGGEPIRGEVLPHQEAQKEEVSAQAGSGAEGDGARKKSSGHKGRHRAGNGAWAGR